MEILFFQVAGYDALCLQTQQPGVEPGVEAGALKIQGQPVT